MFIFCVCTCVSQRVTGDLSALNECCSSSQGCMLLLVLKQHLKKLFGLSDKFVFTCTVFVIINFPFLIASANNILQLRLVLKLMIRPQHENKDCI